MNELAVSLRPHHFKMKVIRYIIIAFSIIILAPSCRKKLNLEIIFENSEIKLERYQVSGITSIHEFIDITGKRWNKTERIYESNTGSIDYILVSNDSIIIKSHNKFTYDLSAKKFGYNIVLD